MGNWLGNVWDRLFGEKREFKLVIVGLDAAGKTTILNKMRFDEVMPTAPTIGVNTEDIQIRNVNIKVFDLAGQEKMRNVWKYYYSSIEGIIFVLDSTRADRIQEARDELVSLLANEEARHIPVLVFANKQDLPTSIKSQEMVEMLGIGDYVNKKPVSIVRVQESSAVQDQGLLEGFEWIVDKIITMGIARQ
jgi:ADP-ribosylation factor 1/2